MNKKSLRNLFKKKRQQFSKTELESISKQVRLQLTNEFEFKNKLVNVFLPIERFNEIDLSLFIDDIQELGGQVCLNKSDFKSNSITPYLYVELSHIQTNEYGIPEPTEGSEIPLNHIDFVIVPLLTFDQNGHRVGYGKGFYDRFLASFDSNTLFIGVCHFDEPSNIEDLSEQDVPLHYIITPKRIYKFS